MTGRGGEVLLKILILIVIKVLHEPTSTHGRSVRQPKKKKTLESGTSGVLCCPPDAAKHRTRPGGSPRRTTNEGLNVNVSPEYTTAASETEE